MRTFQDMAKEALMAQDASNLSGVVHSWSRLLPDLRARVVEECQKNNTDFSTSLLNGHPINLLFADKVSGMTQQSHTYTSAYEWCKLEAG